MADFGVYGDVFNRTYYDFPTPTANDPEHGKWVTKPQAVSAGDDASYHLADKAGCHGSQATFYSRTGQMDYKWSVSDPYNGDNLVTPYSMNQAVKTWYEAKSGSSTTWTKDSTPKGGHPLYVRHYVTHNPEYLLPPGTQQRQQRSMWCWAACVSMVVSYYRYSGSPSAVPQCDLVTGLLKHHTGTDYNCCKPGVPDRVCDVPATTADVTSYLKSYGLSATANGWEPAAATISTSLTAFRPMILGITWRPDFGGHMAVLQGITGSGSSARLSVYDPEYGVVSGTYTNIMNNYQSYGEVVLYISTNFTRPWTGTVKLPKARPARELPAGSIGDRREILVGYLPPTDEALAKPAAAVDVRWGEFQRVDAPGAEGGSQERLVIFEPDSGVVAQAFEGQDFVRALRRTVDRARKEAAKQRQHHEVVYVPLPHLRVDAAIVFNPKTRRQKSVFVVPKAHERELRKAGPYTPSEFWRTMRSRLAKLRQVHSGDEQVWR